MAAKGDKGALEPVARQLYAQGWSQTAIAQRLGVSNTTVCKWKADSQVPGEEMDEWDKARARKRSTVERLATLFERELQAAEEAAPGSVSPASWDALQKLGGMARQWQQIERADAEAANGAANIDRPALFLENLEWIIGTLRVLDPQAVNVLARNFDSLIERFKAEFAGV